MQAQGGMMNFGAAESMRQQVWMMSRWPFFFDLCEFWNGICSYVYDMICTCTQWAMLIICIYKKMTRYTKGFGLLPPEYTSFSHSSFLHFHNLASDMVFTLHLPRKCSVVQTRMTGSNWANDASPAFAAAPQQVPRPWGTGREGKFCEIWRLST